jgi:hypothetical protein
MELPSLCIIAPALLVLNFHGEISCLFISSQWPDPKHFQIPAGTLYNTELWNTQVSTPELCFDSSVVWAGQGGTLLIPALGRLRQNDLEFRSSGPRP